MIRVNPKISRCLIGGAFLNNVDQVSSGYRIFEVGRNGLKRWSVYSAGVRFRVMK